MTRAAALVALLLSGCAHLPALSAITPDSLTGASLVAEGWCSSSESGSREVWYCRVYERGGRVLVGIYHALSGQLTAIGERIADGVVVIRWTAPEEEDVPEDGAGVAL